MKKTFTLFMLSVVFSICSFGQWTEQATGFLATSTGVQYMCIVDANVVWITGYDGSGGAATMSNYSKTTDGGATWKVSVPSGYATWGSSMIYAIDKDIAWMPVYNPAGGGKVLKTTNGGTNWAVQATAAFAAPSGFPNVIHFWDANTGFCMGDPNGGYFEIYTTADGGTTWTRVPQANIPAPSATDEYGTVGLYTVVGDNIWFSTTKGRVFKSADKGLNWTVATTPLAESFKITFMNANHGIAFFTTSNKLYESTDGGATWSEITPTGNFYTSDVSYVPGTPSTLVSTGNSSGISYSLYGGKMWKDFPGTIPGQMLNTGWLDNTTGWVGNFTTSSTSGGIYKYTGDPLPSPKNNDISVVAMKNPVSGGILTASEKVSVDLFNAGLVSQTGFNVTYIINNGTPVTEAVSTTITAGATHTYTFAPTENLSANGVYNFKVYTSLSSDEDKSNDTLKEDIVLMTVVPVKRALHEVFTSSTCPPCATSNPIIDGVCYTNTTNYENSTLVKYQVSWPSPGDPYTTGEVANRTSLYGVSSVPSMFVDHNKTNPDAYSQTIFDSFKNRVAFYDIASKHYINGNSIDMDITITPHKNLSTTCYVAVVEKKTTGNVGSNGETEFHNVMMKMVPNDLGTAINLVAETPYNLKLNVDMTSTFVEEMGDLKVVIWLQDPLSLEVFQSNYSEFTVSIPEQNNQQSVSIYPSPSTGVIYINNAANNQISVFDMLGNTVYTRYNTDSKTSVDLKNLPNGTYVVKALNNDNVTIKKIILNK